MNSQKRQSVGAVIGKVTLKSVPRLIGDWDQWFSNSPETVKLGPVPGESSDIPTSILSSSSEKVYYPGSLLLS
ncbi:hypothetical protein Glove_5g30 [Diversispora epigaea]|uniref:Uncharacterized protein n=1 Tax=Diversispora epigaea TaxID=1348612 RepID=A0A397K060_9GLOM|nr:hypothetical protein Glove_5g30 [Diversispora epigaea]